MSYNPLFGETSATTINFDWAHFAQVEIHHRESLTFLRETFVAAEETEKATRRHSLGKTLNPFSSIARQEAEVRREALSDLANADRCIKEEQMVLMENEHRLHEALHRWLMITDGEYRKSAEIELSYRKIESHIEPLATLLADLLSKYGFTRNEIAISFNHEIEAVSPAAHASLNRLIDSYKHLLAESRPFAGELDKLNTMVKGTMFEKLRLMAFTKTIAPDFHAKMTYLEMREVFESGATQVKAALEQLRDYTGPVGAAHSHKDEILFEYREAKWRQYLAAIQRGEDVPADERRPQAA